MEDQRSARKLFTLLRLKDTCKYVRKFIDISPSSDVRLPGVLPALNLVLSVVKIQSQLALQMHI